MLENLIIRQERPEDYKGTELMAMRSFWNKYWPGATEHAYVKVEQNKIYWTTADDAGSVEIW